MKEKIILSMLMLLIASPAVVQAASHRHVTVSKSRSTVVVHRTSPTVVVRPTPIATAARIVTTAAIVSSLPKHYTKVVYHGTPYYTHGGVYYVEVNKGYKQVDPPQEIILYSLPKDAIKMSVNGEIRYQHNNAILLPVLTDEGMAYKVIGEVK